MNSVLPFPLYQIYSLLHSIEVVAYIFIIAVLMAMLSSVAINELYHCHVFVNICSCDFLVSIGVYSVKFM